MVEGFMAISTAEYNKLKAVQMAALAYILEQTEENAQTLAKALGWCQLKIPPLLREER